MVYAEMELLTASTYSTSIRVDLDESKSVFLDRAIEKSLHVWEYVHGYVAI
jgi:hypothetical protein